MARGVDVSRGNDQVSLDGSTHGADRVGVRPYPAYKDSGEPWIGLVPAHWKVLALKHVVKMKSGEQITADAIEETGIYPVFGGNGLRVITHSPSPQVVLTVGGLSGECGEDDIEGVFPLEPGGVDCRSHIGLGLGCPHRTVAVGYLSLDHAGPQLAFRSVVGGRHLAGKVAKRQ